MTGDPVSFKCGLIRTARDVKFSWSKDGIALTVNERIRVLELGDSSVLTIKKTRTRDSGIYTCIADNVASESRQTTRLSVNGELFSQSYGVKLIPNTVFPVSLRRGTKKP